MTSQRDTLGWLKQGARAFAFGNPLYGLTLGGRGVTGLAAVPNDPWPGDSDTRDLGVMVDRIRLTIPVSRTAGGSP